MNNLNSILLEGALVADPELSYKTTGEAVCSFTIMVKRNTVVAGESQVQERRFDVRCETRLAEVCAEYLKKGRGVRVVGRLDMVDAGNASQVFVAAEHVEFKPQAFTGKDKSAGKSADSAVAEHDERIPTR